MKKLRALLTIIPFVILIVTVQYKGLFSDFILDDEKESSKTPVVENEKLPKYIARNIKAEIIPDIKGAIRISWEAHKDSDDDYIVGRSMSVPDTMEKALKSVSIKVVPAGASTEFIDSNLKPGAYYYCVLAKSRIMDRDIKLYADQNYTNNPVVMGIELKREGDRIFPQQVSLVYARILDKSQVRITWKGVEARGIIYTIYRGNSPLDSPAKLAQAEKIKVIADGKESYIDSNINKSGNYFYAVTTRDISGNEDLNLTPDQSYTESGVYVSLELPLPVNNISARSFNNSIRITWGKTSSGVAEYLIYRYSSPISDSDKMSLSTLLGRVPENETVYTDLNPAVGNYYYAVLTKFLNGKVLNDLIKDDNYTSEPVAIGIPIRILSFTGRAYEGDIELTWKTSGNLGNKDYKILRKMSGIKTSEDLQDADIAAYVNINDLKCIDAKLPPGTYYYAIVPRSEDNKEFTLAAGVNVIEKGIVIAGKEVAGIKTPEEKTPGEKPEPKIPRIIEKKRGKESARETKSGIDVILQKYFLTGKYKQSLRELEDIVKKSDNEKDVARARLFIGRTLIELKKYREAVQYLILKDVNDHYPDEARFWREYALSRIPNG